MDSRYKKIIKDKNSTVNHKIMLCYSWQEEGFYVSKCISKREVSEKNSTFLWFRYYKSYYWYWKATERIKEREYRPFREIRDGYPRYIISLDKFRDKQEGVHHINAIDLFLGKEIIWITSLTGAFLFDTMYRATEYSMRE